MDDNFEDNLALTPKKSHVVPSSRREFIIQELLNELLVINDVIEKEKTHPFSSLEVILEEVTPCSSSQRLENNLSAIKAQMKTHAQDQDLKLESVTDSDEEFDIRGEFFQNTNSLNDMYNTNLFFIKQRAQIKNVEDCNSDISSTTSTKIVSTFNDSNTSNKGGRSGESSKTSGSLESAYKKRNSTKFKCNSESSEDDSEDNKTSCETANFENTNDNDKKFRKYDRFINDDDRFEKKENPRNKFLTLNRNYDRCSRNLKRTNREYSSTSNLENREYSSTSNIEKFSEKENKSPSPPVVKTPLRNESNKPNRNYCGDVSFTCLNSYSVKTKPNSYQSLGKIDYNSCTVEELEERLKYFEDQVQNIQDTFKENMQSNELTSYKYQSENQVSSAEDDAHNCLVWRSKLNNTFNLDRSDNKSIDNCSNSNGKIPVKMGHIESSPNDSVQSFEENKSSENNYSESESDHSLKENNATYSGSIIIVKKSSKETCDSGLYTRSSPNRTENYDTYGNHIEEETEGTYPKIMYPSITKDVSTQITDTDWKKICFAKKEMAEAGYLRLNLPNSSDDELLDELKKNETKVLFKSKTAIINASYSESSTDTTPAFSTETVAEEISGCSCSCLKKLFSKR